MLCTVVCTKSRGIKSAVENAEPVEFMKFWRYILSQIVYFWVVTLRSSTLKDKNVCSSKTLLTTYKVS
jgi:hypothetical protein